MIFDIQPSALIHSPHFSCTKVLPSLQFLSSLSHFQCISPSTTIIIHFTFVYIIALQLNSLIPWTTPTTKNMCFSFLYTFSNNNNNNTSNQTCIERKKDFCGTQNKSFVANHRTKMSKQIRQPIYIVHVRVWELVYMHGILSESWM